MRLLNKRDKRILNKLLELSKLPYPPIPMDLVRSPNEYSTVMKCLWRLEKDNRIELVRVRNRIRMIRVLEKVS